MYLICQCFLGKTRTGKEELFAAASKKKEEDDDDRRRRRRRNFNGDSSDFPATYLHVKPGMQGDKSS